MPKQPQLTETPVGYNDGKAPNDDGGCNDTRNTSRREVRAEARTDFGNEDSDDHKHGGLDQMKDNWVGGDLDQSVRVGIAKGRADIPCCRRLVGRPTPQPHRKKNGILYSGSVRCLCPDSVLRSDKAAQKNGHCRPYNREDRTCQDCGQQ